MRSGHVVGAALRKPRELTSSEGGSSRLEAWGCRPPPLDATGRYQGDCQAGVCIQGAPVGPYLHRDDLHRILLCVCEAHPNVELMPLTGAAYFQRRCSAFMLVTNPMPSQARNSRSAVAFVVVGALPAQVAVEEFRRHTVQPAHPASEPAQVRTRCRRSTTSADRSRQQRPVKLAD